MMLPADLSIRRITMVEVVDLPQPDSPTRPTLSPRCTVKLMPSTARNIGGSAVGVAPLRLNSPAKRAAGVLARIFLDELFDHQQRRAVAGRRRRPRR